MGSRTRSLLLLEVSGAWAAANVIPHVIIIALAGKPYFALDPAAGMLCELAIMSLNLALPVLIVARMRARDSHSLRDRLRRGLAWQWRGRSTGLWGLAGFLAGFVLLFPAVNIVVGSTPFPYGGGIGPITPENSYICLLLPLLWIVTTLGEEVMFRGYVQTRLAEGFGTVAGVVAGALLFALRHTPADLYWGWNAPALEWASRLLQLLGLAIVLGLVRYRSQSTVSTWIAHAIGWIYVVFFAAL